jgi:tryptophanyl-tRNA synthetase
LAADKKENRDETGNEIDYGTFQAAINKSNQIEKEINNNPQNFLVLTGDRPTGRLHIGHLFGSLQSRVRLQNLGVPIFVVIADYQVLTDRDTCDNISENVKQLTIDYIATGLNPENDNTKIFPHSHIPELNQLLLPFLTLVTNAELDRNPTVKEEIEASGQQSISAGMYVYPVHQAADILFCKANVVPVGKDQLPHLELTRTIARRFNKLFSQNIPIFREPHALLSDIPLMRGLDGSSKMSKSRNNTIALSLSEDETAKQIKAAKTDSYRMIAYDPDNRPEVSNLLLIASLCQGKSPEEIATEIGNSGSSRLKSYLTESVNEYLRPIRKRRLQLEKDPGYIRGILIQGIQTARIIAQNTLDEVRDVMGMSI